MATRLPIYYCSTLVGFARVDDSLATLSSTIVWTLHVPRAVRRTGSGRKEIIVGLLYNDDSLRVRCKPQTWLTPRVPVHLSHVALRPQLIELLNAPIRDEVVIAKAIEICRTVGPIGYRDEDRTNCTSTNLREFSPLSGWESLKPEAESLPTHQLG